MRGWMMESKWSSSCRHYSVSLTMIPTGILLPTSKATAHNIGPSLPPDRHCIFMSWPFLLRVKMYIYVPTYLVSLPCILFTGISAYSHSFMNLASFYTG
ncbi:hypothetical protein BGX38DRAFT_1172276 [Terfezia claveryi]|nr:hypothetical protein BGX38DRAFT_1172276 [Terfezia claveryi]